MPSRLFFEVRALDQKRLTPNGILRTEYARKLSGIVSPTTFEIGVFGIVKVPLLRCKEFSCRCRLNKGSRKQIQIVFAGASMKRRRSHVQKGMSRFDGVRVGGCEMSERLGSLRVGGIHGSKHVTQLQLLVYAHVHAQPPGLGMHGAEKSSPLGIAHHGIASHQANGPGDVAWLVVWIGRLAQRAA